MSFQAVPGSHAAVPLASLPAVVVDTETTGLDVARDRVIEIAGVRLVSPGGPGAVTAETHSTLIAPGIAIPASASDVHGIGDEDVAGAPGFAEAMPAFSAWVGPSVVIGFSLGFDLAVLEAEHERHGLQWRAPRSLDVRHLAQLVGPVLPELSLELVAQWLGIAAADRHRALADARLAADIFRALLPKLRGHGIATLAQAERACRSLTLRLEEEARAGWHGVAAPGAAADTAEYARIDSYPYRHRVADLMRAPPIVVDGGMALKEALSAMVGEMVSSLFVAPERAGGAYGIITERDALRAIEARGGAAIGEPVAALARRPLVSVERDEFAYRALTRMAGGGFRHLGVVDAKGRLVGALSARDLLRQRADDAVSLGDSIEAAETVGELGRVWSELTVVARALAGEEVDARDIAAIVSRELRALTRRACELAERELADAGRGAAPAKYALLVLGSGGRGESLLAMDQDNAIVHAGTGGEADEWFALLGTRIADILDTVGVAYCNGGVMASNAEWRHDLAGWRGLVGSWITRSRPKDILNSDIFFDATPVHGDIALAETLLGEARAAAKSARSFLQLLALNAAEFRSPTGWLGRLTRGETRVDLKAGGLMPIFSAARVAALAHGIDARSTPERLRAAAKLGIATEKTVDNLAEAHRILLDLILRQQLADIDLGLPLCNKVDKSALSGLQRRNLSWALDQIPSVADLLGVPLLR